MFSRFRLRNYVINRFNSFDNFSTDLKQHEGNKNVSLSEMPNGKSYFRHGSALLLGIGLGYYVKSKWRKRELTLSNMFESHSAYCATKPSNLRKQFNFIADVVEMAAESVVYIEMLDNRRRMFSGEAAPVSNGSGFIIQSDGLILTNAHVVVQQGPNSVRVKLHDGTTYNGRIESIDMKSDLATIRINADNLPVMNLGTSSDLRPGEWVVAIGSPLTLSNTVTAGVVSASQRPGTQLGIPNSGINYIQTDASITFGNSGGPLVNLDGEAIGINSIKITSGISFAIPIDYAKEFLAKNRTKISQSGDITSMNYIGIVMVTLKPEFVQVLQSRGLLPNHVTKGILVWKIADNGPAARAGLMPGDVITHVNGKEASTVQQMYDAMETSKKLVIYALRNAHPIKIEITPERM